MKLRTYLARNAGPILTELRRAFARNHAQLPQSLTRRCLAKLDAAALHLGSLNPAKVKNPSALQHRADLDCLHALIHCASTLNCHALYNDLRRNLS